VIRALAWPWSLGFAQTVFLTHPRVRADVLHRGRRQCHGGEESGWVSHALPPVKLTGTAHTRALLHARLPATLRTSIDIFQCERKKMRFFDGAEMDSDLRRDDAG
jgi:hypothetical protein